MIDAGDKVAVVSKTVHIEGEVISIGQRPILRRNVFPPEAAVVTSYKERTIPAEEWAEVQFLGSPGFYKVPLSFIHPCGGEP